MEVPWQNFLSDMEMEDVDFFNQSDKNSFDDEELVLTEILQQSAFSSESESHSPPTPTPTPNNGGSSLSCEGTTASFLNKNRDKLLSKSNSSNSIMSQHVPDKPATATSPASYVLTFDESTVVTAATWEAANGRKQHPKRDQAAARASKGANLATRKGRSSSESLDHIMAERKRRQELTERFIALSATIPGLKKIDKASILSEAITYVKQLQKRVRELEEQSSCKKIKVGSASFINEAHLCSDEGTVSSCKTKSDDCHRLNVALPEVEARLLENEVLIRIHCKKQNGVMLKILTQLKSLDLSTASNSVLPFGNSVLDITIIAQMGDKYNLTVKDLVKSLRQALLELRDVQH